MRRSDRISAECDFDGDNCITFDNYQTWNGYYFNQ